MKHFTAIAAMSENRVIGNGGKIPWHLPEDFKFFRKMTTGNILVMGRRTFQGIGRPLPDRHTIVLSRKYSKPKEILEQPELPLYKWGTFEVAAKLEKIRSKYASDPRQIYICGGGQVYAETLELCLDLYLTKVKQVVEGDTFFPKFEDRFRLVETILETPEFNILHYESLDLE